MIVEQEKSQISSFFLHNFTHSMGKRGLQPGCFTSKSSLIHCCMHSTHWLWQLHLKGIFRDMSRSQILLVQPFRITATVMFFFWSSSIVFNHVACRCVPHQQGVLLAMYISIQNFLDLHLCECTIISSFWLDWYHYTGGMHCFLIAFLLLKQPVVVAYNQLSSCKPRQQ